ncbi:MAG: hypothetical protein LDL50_00550, partial [Chloroflexi bacterium]|nr:hypothetical protein [Chloroflexota bacterium]
MKKQPLLWFLGIAFLFSWTLFLIPLLFEEMDPAAKQLATQGFWALAMWGPGVAAIAATTLVMKRPLNALRLNKLGAKRFYLWAWLLPIGLSILGGLFTLLFGVAELDLNFTMMKEAMASAAGGSAAPAELVVAIQILLAFTLAPFFNVVFTLGEELGWRGFLLPHLLPLGQW